MSKENVQVGLSRQLIPANDTVDTPKVWGSQDEALCDEEDEELTEEEYDLDGEQDGDDNDHSTDASSTYSMQDSDVEDDTAISVSPEIQELIQQMPELADNYHILGKIGEGTFSSVYKAVDLKYQLYVNSWDPSWNQARKWSSPPIKSKKGVETKRPAKYVALKRIYATSSPVRILNELALLHHLKGCDKVVSLITAFRNEDQVVAVLPYFKHIDFRDYYRTLSLRDIRLYFLSLFSALDHVHTKGILHRDIKPSNFLFDISTRQGVLVDFGLAEYEDPADAERCPCSQTTSTRTKHVTHNQRLSRATPLDEGPGYLKHDQRPAKRANRAGTRGFRAPEVLLKCQSQSTKIDIWSCGVILLSFLTKRFPFFNSADDVDATIELTSIFGKPKMRNCAELHNCTFDATLPTLSEKAMPFQKIIKWATSEMDEPDWEQKLALDFLDVCMELNPHKRISAAAALQHPFLSCSEEDEGLEDVFLT